MVCKLASFFCHCENHWSADLGRQNARRTGELPLYITVCETVFAEVIDHRSRVKMIHHRPTVYTHRPEMPS